MVYERTGGNPFFVTEVLANMDQEIPDTIRDAVLARLSPAARDVVEFVSMVPGKTERRLLEKFFDYTAVSLGECVDTGILRDDGNAIAFRHELSRLAIEDSLNTFKRQSLHAEILQALRERGIEETGIARLVHHATRAGDRRAVREFAPLAGKQAAALGAHREAASHYKTALEYADDLPPDQRVALLEARSYECYLTDQLEEAIRARSEAYSIWENLQQPEKEGESLRWLSRLSWFLGRRADPGAQPALDEARELAIHTGELQRIAPAAAAARAEAAWLKENPEQCLKEAQAAYELALQHRHVWWIGALAFWVWRAGGLAELPENAAEPYRKHISGDWQSAAETWMEMGCRYESALALADGDEATQLKALAIFREMGANPAADLMEKRLRAGGIRSIPRGPRPSTQKNPAGLTARQMEVLALLAEGLQNAEIAERLFISPKTVDHHISAILSKLNVSSRAKAVTAATALGLI